MSRQPKARLSRPWRLAGALALGLLAAVALGWLMDKDLRQALAVGRAETAALPLLAGVREELRSAAEDLLAGENMNGDDRDRLVQRARIQADEAKAAGHSSHLILDPQLDIYHLAYLSTVKMPERLALELELAALERRADGRGPRAEALRADLLEAWQEEDRALKLALVPAAGALGQALDAQNQERRARLDAYLPGQRLRLRDLAREDLHFWTLCDERLADALGQRQADLQAERLSRPGLVGLGLLLLSLGLWAFLRPSPPTPGTP